MSTFNNFSNTSLVDPCPFSRPHSPLEENVQRSAYFLVAFVGIFSNFLVIVAAVKLTVRKNLHHLIINMAVSDTIFIIVLTYEHSRWLFDIHTDSSIYPDGLLGDILCKARAFLLEVSYRVSLVTLLVISIERFRATRLTLRRVRPYTIRQRMAVLFACWLLPVCFYAIYLKSTSDGRFCRIPFDDSTIMNVIATFLTVLILCITSILSLMTVHQMHRNNKNTANLVEQYSLRRARQIRSIVRMVVVSTILYAVCWFPHLVYYFLMSLNILYYKNSEEKKILMNINELCIDRQAFQYIRDMLLPALNSCLSPFIYVVFLPDFREAMKKLFCCRNSNYNIHGERTAGTLQMISHRQSTRARTLSSVTQSTAF